MGNRKNKKEEEGRKNNNYDLEEKVDRTEQRKEEEWKAKE